MKTTDDFWRWAQNVIMQEIRVQRYYNNAPPYGLRGFLDDKANRIIGYPILRQVRNARYVCQAPNPMNYTIFDCTGTRGVLTEDDQDYCAGWLTKYWFQGSCNYDEFKYKTGDELQTYSTTGRLGTYGAGGYIVRLNQNQDTVIDRIKELQKRRWIDRRTRVVFLEFSVYNANVNMFTSCVVSLEFNEGGGIVPKWRFEPVRLLKLDGSTTDNVVYLCEFLFILATAFFTVRQLWEMRKQKLGYFSQYWNIAEFLIIVVSWVEFGIYLYKLQLTSAALLEFNRTKGNAYVRMDSAVTVDQYYIYILGFIMFVSLLKLIKLLQFNKRFGVLAETIGLCWNELSIFFIAFAVVFFAFCALFYFMFFMALREFSTIMAAVQTSFSMMLGKFDFERMKQANSLSPLLFFVFSLTNSMVLINIMLSIILKAFNEVKVDIAKKANRYDVMDFMWAKLKKNAVLQPNQVNQVTVDFSWKKEKKASTEVEEDKALPDKVSIVFIYYYSSAGI